MAYLPPDARVVCEEIRRTLGMDYEYRWEQLERRLVFTLSGSGCHDIREYRQYLQSPTHKEHELKYLASIVTNNETYFFREASQINAFTGPVLDDILSRTRGGKCINIWSAACSSGEEPYSLVMALRESGKVKDNEFYLLATDLSERILQTARLGIYRKYSFRAIEQERIAKYFTPGVDGSHVHDDVKNFVTFQCFNLVNYEGYHQLGEFDVIFCRNVMMYFSRETQREVMKALAQALRPGGYLILGHADSLYEVDDLFTSILINDAVVHRRKPVVAATNSSLHVLSRGGS